MARPGSKRTQLPTPLPLDGEDVFGEDGISVREVKYLEALKRAGLALSRPRTIAFGFVSESPEQAAALEAALPVEGFKVSSSNADGKLAFWITSVSSERLVLPEALLKWSSAFRDAAATVEGARYDGWTAFFSERSPQSRAEFSFSR